MCHNDGVMKANICTLRPAVLVVSLLFSSLCLTAQSQPSVSTGRGADPRRKPWRW